MRESLVLRDMEEERTAELFFLRCILTAMINDDNGAASQANLGEYLSIQLPWLRGSPEQEKEAEKSEVDKMIDMYNQVQKMKGKE